MPCGRYIKRQNMSGKCLSTSIRVQMYDFLTHRGPIYLPIKYRNFAQSSFNVLNILYNICYQGIYARRPEIVSVCLCTLWFLERLYQKYIVVKIAFAHSQTLFLLPVLKRRLEVMLRHIKRL